MDRDNNTHTNMNPDTDAHIKTIQHPGSVTKTETMQNCTNVKAQRQAQFHPVNTPMDLNTDQKDPSPDWRLVKP